jgi:hypothetical protein
VGGQAGGWVDEAVRGAGQGVEAGLSVLPAFDFLASGAAARQVDGPLHSQQRSFRHAADICQPAALPLPLPLPPCPQAHLTEEARWRYWQALLDKYASLYRSSQAEKEAARAAAAGAKRGGGGGSSGSGGSGSKAGGTGGEVGALAANGDVDGSWDALAAAARAGTAAAAVVAEEPAGGSGRSGGGGARRRPAAAVGADVT